MSEFLIRERQHGVALMIFVMRVTMYQLVLSVCMICSLSAKETMAQNILERKFTLSVKDMEMSKVIALVQKQTKVKFNYSENSINLARKVTYSFSDQSLNVFLLAILSDYGIGHRLVDDRVVLYKVDVSNQPQPPGPGITTPSSVTITGRVVNDLGEPIADVTILEKATRNGTSSDENGNFSINVAGPKSVLTFSRIGFSPTEITVGAQSTLNIVLAASVNSMEDVVVIGFGSQKKATVTGSIASVTTKELVQSPVANISNSLVGRMPGLFATQSSGEPGNDQSRLFIRGVGTFSGNTDPLILVDGIQVDNYNNLDPNEIESLTILKDAATTAVYGVRGANGVILITTRRGKTGPPRLSYTFNIARNAFTAIRSQMSSYDYANSFNQALKNDAYVSQATYVPRFTDADLEKYKSGSDPVFYPNVDWYDLMLEDYSLQTQHNITISGGAEKMKYFISAGYFDQAGLFKDTRDIVPGFDSQVRFKRYNFRSNFNFDITKRFRALLDLSSQTENRSGNNANTQTVIEFIARANPIGSPGAVDGKIVNLNTSANNPLSTLLSAGYRREYRNYLNGSIRLEHDLDFITRGLSIYGTVAYQNVNTQRIVNTKQLITYLPFRTADGGYVLAPQQDEAAFGYAEVNAKNRRTNAEIALNYRRTFGDHTVTGLVLYNQIKRYNDTLPFLIPNGYQNLVGRLTYNFRSKYLVEYSLGYNGTENFAPGKRFGFFPAYSLGWVVSEEKFFPKSNVITFLKFRGSWGVTGNDRVGGDRFLYNPTTYSYYNPYSGQSSGAPQAGYYFGTVGSTYTPYRGIAEGRAGNPELTWEEAVKKNVGVEVNLLGNKISIIADVFDDLRDNILAIPGRISAISGFQLPPYNLGKMNNRGFDGEIQFNDKIGTFTYFVKANYTFARNKILYQDEVTRPFEYQQRTGRRYGQYFGFISEGFYNNWGEVNDPRRPRYELQNDRIQPGDLKFSDVSGDGIINDDDIVPIGYANIPEKTYGFTLGGNYKGIDFSILFQGVDNVSLNYTRRFNSAFFDNPAAGAVDYLIESWTQERYDQGLPINFPRFQVATPQSINYQSSTFFLADASYLRLKNVEIGYSIPRNVLQRIKLASARIFLSANNLFTWSKVYPGVDPESPPTPTNLEPYPLVRTINAGINITF